MEEKFYKEKIGLSEKEIKEKQSIAKNEYGMDSELEKEFKKV